MLVWSWLKRGISSSIVAVGGGLGLVSGGGGVAATTGIWTSGGRWNVGVAIGVTAMAGLALAATLVISSRRGSLKSPWSRQIRKRALSYHQWTGLFSADGKLRDGGLKLLKKVRSGGIDPNIRAEVWPFLLGVYDLNSSEAERKTQRLQLRKQYMRLRRKCHFELTKGGGDNNDRKIKHEAVDSSSENLAYDNRPQCSVSEDKSVASQSLVNDGLSGDSKNPLVGNTTYSNSSAAIDSEEAKSDVTHVDCSLEDKESSGSISSAEEDESSQLLFSYENKGGDQRHADVTLLDQNSSKGLRSSEDFNTWQRIIRLDAVRANGEWIPYSPTQASASEDKALKFAEDVGLEVCDHLEPCRLFHAARLVAILEAYAVYDPEIGYCQGMSDLLSPIAAVLEQDYEAFWCFVGFMKKARHNFRLDEAGIRRQLDIVSRIIKSKDTDLYTHLVKLQAEDCFFVYRMVVVLFRRELTFEQTLCLWEVMWADQAALRSGIGKSMWERIQLRIPPTDDLLLYAIAATVLQKRKLIIEKYSSMDEIMRECHSLAGQLDVWKLLHDAHHLVVAVHDRIS